MSSGSARCGLRPRRCSTIAATHGPRRASSRRRSAAGYSAASAASSAASSWPRLTAHTPLRRRAHEEPPERRRHGDVADPGAAAPAPVGGGRHAQVLRGALVEAAARSEPRVVHGGRHRLLRAQPRADEIEPARVRVLARRDPHEPAKHAVDVMRTLPELRGERAQDASRRPRALRCTGTRPRRAAPATRRPPPRSGGTGGTRETRRARAADGAAKNTTCARPGRRAGHDGRQ